MTAAGPHDTRGPHCRSGHGDMRRFSVTAAASRLRGQAVLWAPRACHSSQLPSPAPAMSPCHVPPRVQTRPSMLLLLLELASCPGALRGASHPIPHMEVWSCW